MRKRRAERSACLNAIAIFLCFTLLLESVCAAPWETLAPPSLFAQAASPVALEKDQEAELWKIGRYVYEHRHRASAGNLHSTTKEYESKYGDAAKPILVFFEHIQRIAPDVVAIPFCVGKTKFIAWLHPSTGASTERIHQGIALDVKRLPDIPMIAGQESAPEEPSRFEVAKRLAARIDPRGSSPWERRTPSGVSLIAGNGLSPLSQNLKMSWMENLAGRLRECQVPVTKIQVNVKKTPGAFSTLEAQPIQLDIEWDAGFGPEGPPASVTFLMDNTMPDNMIVETVVSLARLYWSLPQSVLPICVEYPHHMPPVDVRSKNRIYLGEEDQGNAEGILRSLHFYSQVLRVLLRSAEPEVQEEEALIHLLTFRLMLYMQLPSEEDKEDLLSRLDRSAHIRDRLTHETIIMLKASPNLLLPKYDDASWRHLMARILDSLERTSKRPSLLSKESPIFAARAAEFGGNGDTELFIAKVLEHYLLLNSWRETLVQETLAHADAVKVSAEATRHQRKKEQREKIRILSKTQRQDIIDKGERILPWLPDKILDEYLDAWIRRGEKELGIGPPDIAAQTAVQTAEKTDSQAMTAWGSLSARWSGLELPPLRHFLWIGVHYAIAITLYLKYGGTQTPLQAVVSIGLLYTYLATVADYYGQVFSGRRINRLLAIISAPIEVGNALLTIGVNYLMNMIVPYNPEIRWSLLLGFILAVRFGIIMGLSFGRGRFYGWASENRFQRQMAFLVAMKNISAKRKYRGNPKELAIQLENIKQAYRNDRRNREERAARAQLKQDVMWKLLRTLALGKYAGLAYVADAGQRALLDGLIEPGFTTSYRVARNRKGILVPKEEAVKPWYELMWYPYIVFARSLQGPIPDDPRPELLEQSQHPPQISRLFCELDEPDADIRICALRDLGEMKYAPATPVLMWLADHDPDFEVRFTAIGAIQKQDDPEAIPALVTILQSNQRVLYPTARSALDALLNTALSRNAPLEPKTLESLIRMLGDPLFRARAESLLEKQPDQTMPLLDTYRSWLPARLDRRHPGIARLKTKLVQKVGAQLTASETTATSTVPAVRTATALPAVPATDDSIANENAVKVAL